MISAFSTICEGTRAGCAKPGNDLSHGHCTTVQYSTVMYIDALRTRQMFSLTVTHKVNANSGTRTVLNSQTYSKEA